jgi:hypothetical protein
VLLAARESFLSEELRELTEGRWEPMSIVGVEKVGYEADKVVDWISEYVWQRWVEGVG